MSTEKEFIHLVRCKKPRDRGIIRSSELWGNSACYILIDSSLHNFNLISVIYLVAGHECSTYREDCYMAEFEFRNIGFCGGRETVEPGEKPSK